MSALRRLVPQVVAFWTSIAGSRRHSIGARQLGLPERPATEQKLNGAIHVINPNSSPHVTAAIEFAAAPFRSAGSKILCVEMKAGPPGIQSESDLHAAVAPMLAYVLGQEAEAGAFVVACFGDPGLHLLRERVRPQVFGIGECGVLAALARGQRFGVISLLQTSLARHLRCIGAMGVGNRLAQDRAMGLGVAELRDHGRMFERMIAVGRQLQQQDGADVVLLGGAAMSEFRAPLEQELGIPVIDPTFAALVMADGVAKLR